MAQLLGTGDNGCHAQGSACKSQQWEGWLLPKKAVAGRGWRAGATAVVCPVLFTPSPSSRALCSCRQRLTSHTDLLAFGVHLRLEPAHVPASHRPGPEGQSCMAPLRGPTQDAPLSPALTKDPGTAASEAGPSHSYNSHSLAAPKRGSKIPLDTGSA